MTVAFASMNILLADDDLDDQAMTVEALQKEDGTGSIACVDDGEQLMDYLHRRGQYSDAQLTRPELILLDLNMPRKGGYEVLAELKADPDMRTIPIVVLSTSNREQDVARSYELGASSFITKPSSFDDFVEDLRTLKEYWFGVVTLPGHGR